MLKAQANRLEHYPDLGQRIEQHLDETLGQQQLREQCLAQYDASPSTISEIDCHRCEFADDPHFQDRRSGKAIPAYFGQTTPGCNAEPRRQALEKDCNETRSEWTSP